MPGRSFFFNCYLTDLSTTCAMIQNYLIWTLRALRQHQAQPKFGGTNGVTTMKASFLIVVLFAACAAQTQTLRVVPVHLEETDLTSRSVQFFCTQDYNRDECHQHARELRRVLVTYPLERLGTWSFALVPSDKWRDLIRAIGGPPYSPAFTIFEQRTTVMESSLFSPTATRSAEFQRVFGVTGEALLALAVKHELGHGICQERDELRADDYGRELRQTRSVDCTKTPEGRSTIRSAFRSSQAAARQHQRGTTTR